jgi:hypothetical protein
MTIRFCLIMAAIFYLSPSMCAFANFRDSKLLYNQQVINNFRSLSDDNKLLVLNTLKARSEYIDIPGAAHIIPYEESTDSFVEKLILSLCGN